jgi:prephenate dehydratase
MPGRFQVPKNSSIGFLGPLHSFSHLLAASTFPESRLVDYQQFGDAFEGLLTRKCDFALIPFYNTNGHEVIEAQKEIVRYRNKIFVNDLLGIYVAHSACGFGRKEDLKVVLSKKPVERQISRWLKQEVPHAVFQESSSTSQAILTVSQTRDPSVCAIGNSNAAAAYNVPILEPDIENKPNKTLFFLLSNSCPILMDVENVIVSVTACRDSDITVVVDIVEEHHCSMSAVSRFALDGEKHAYFEICSFHASLNLVSMVKQITANCSNAAVLGGYNRTSIRNLVNEL